MKKSVEVIPASAAQAWFAESLNDFLPKRLRARFDAQALFFAAKPPEFWNDRFAARRTELKGKLLELESWMSERSCELFLSTFDDELLLFYVLKVQAAAVAIAAARPNEPVPADFHRMWLWALDIQPDEGWFAYTIPTQWKLRELRVIPAIWSIPLPVGVH